MNAIGPRMNNGYHALRNTGYGRFGCELHDALGRAGVADYGPVGVNEEMPPNSGIAPVAFYAATPPHIIGWHEGQLSALFTMWESSEIPAGFRENVPDFHRLLVPSMQNVELFGRFHPDVRYVPLAVGPEWHYQPRTDPSQRFNFLTGGAGPRKGVPDVVRAFNTVFRGWRPSMGPEPHLTIRARPTSSAQFAPSSRITVIAQSLPPQGEIDLYAASHCYVSGSRGEGWGFMPHQAIAQGMPTILGDAHGHAAYAWYGMPVRAKEVAIEGYSTHWGQPGNAWVPDFEEICERMRAVYDDPQIAFDYAARSSVLIHDEFSWDKTAAIVMGHLPELEDPDLPEGLPWHRMAQRLYEVEVIRHSTWQINGVLHTYDPGQLYYEAWDMKERLASRGDLSLRCIDPLERGYVDPPKIPKPRCPSCNQRYGVDDSLLPENLVKAQEAVR
jgi:hypothetical protein